MGRQNERCARSAGVRIDVSGVSGGRIGVCGCGGGDVAGGMELVEPRFLDKSMFLLKRKCSNR